MAPELPDEGPTWDSFAIALSGSASMPALCSALSKALERTTAGVDVFAPLVEYKMLREVKFGDMVPEAILRAELAER